MSSAAREEAIEIVRHMLAVDRDTITAAEIVDRLDETFAISRRTPRAHTPSGDPRNAVERAMAGASWGEETSRSYATGAPRGR